MNTEIIKISADDADLSLKIKRAANIITDGGLVVFPTETVYGLGADATNPNAAKKIYKAKGRPSDNPLIIHVADPKDAEKYTHTNEMYYILAEAFMPGPLTVILESKSTVPKETRAGLPTVAVRCPENKIARALIRMSGVPIAAPSANLSGTPSPTSAEHVIDDMLGRVDMIIDGGNADFGLESTIVKIDSEDKLTLLRPGKITVDDLYRVAKQVDIADSVTDKLRDGEIALSPGMKYRHYAPKSPFILLDGDRERMAEFINSESLDRIAIIAYEDDITFFKEKTKNADCFTFGIKSDATTQAKCLFSLLRRADKGDYQKIYAPLPGTSGVGLALYNRMIRAAAHTIIKL